MTKAAAVLRLAQPAVTAQLRRIERLIGGELFARTRLGVSPTPLGELILERARVLLPAARDLQEDAARLAAESRAPVGPRSRLRVGTTGGTYLAGMVLVMAETEPATEVATTASFRSLELLDHLRADRLDCALIGCCGEDGLPDDDPELSVWTLAVEPVCVMLADEHPAGASAEVPLRLLADQHWAWLPGDGCLEDCFVAACVRAGFAPKAAYESDVATCIDLARTGRAVALCLPTRRAPGVVVRPIAGAPLRWVHAMVWRPAYLDAAPDRAAALWHAAVSAYRDVTASAPDHVEWLVRHPSFGLAESSTRSPVRRGGAGRARNRTARGQLRRIPSV